MPLACDNEPVVSCANGLSPKAAAASGTLPPRRHSFNIANYRSFPLLFLYKTLTISNAIITIMHFPNLLTLTLTLILPSLTTAMALPNVICNSTTSADQTLQARGCTMLPLDSKHFSVGGPKLGSPGHEHPRLYRYRIHGGRKEIGFDNWGTRRCLFRALSTCSCIYCSRDIVL